MRFEMQPDLQFLEKNKLQHIKDSWKILALQWPRIRPLSHLQCSILTTDKLLTEDPALPTDLKCQTRGTTLLPTKELACHLPEDLTGLDPGLPTSSLWEVLPYHQEGNRVCPHLPADRQTRDLDPSHQDVADHLSLTAPGATAGRKLTQLLQQFSNKKSIRKPVPNYYKSKDPGQIQSLKTHYFTPCTGHKTLKNWREEGPFLRCFEDSHTARHWPTHR